jgi:hypothetical protein
MKRSADFDADRLFESLKRESTDSPAGGDLDDSDDDLDDEHGEFDDDDEDD